MQPLKATYVDLERDSIKVNWLKRSHTYKLTLHCPSYPEVFIHSHSLFFDKRQVKKKKNVVTGLR